MSITLRKLLECDSEFCKVSVFGPARANDDIMLKIAVSRGFLRTQDGRHFCPLHREEGAGLDAPVVSTMMAFTYRFGDPTTPLPPMDKASLAELHQIFLRRGVLASLSPDGTRLTVFLPVPPEGPPESG